MTLDASPPDAGASVPQPAVETAVSPPDGAAGLAPEQTTRLSDRQAVVLIGLYFGLRFVTVRLGLAFFPALLEDAPWALPLLRNTATTMLAVAAAEPDNMSVLAAALGGSLLISMIAALMLYWAAMRFGPRLAERGGREKTLWSGIWNPKQVAWAEGWLGRWGLLAVAGTRATGLFNAPVVLVAGSTRMPLGRFVAAQLAGAVVWAGGLLFLGVQASDWPWVQRMIELIKSLSGQSLRYGLIAFVVLMLLAGLIGRFSQRNGAKADDASADPTG